MDSYTGGVLLICTVTVLTIAGMFAVRKFFDLDRLKATHEVGGVLFSAIGTLYAVLLGLIVVDAMTKFSDTRDLVQDEANNLANVYLLADCLPDDRKKAVRDLCYRYCKEVVANEWEAMDKAQFSPDGRKMVIKLLQDITSFEPKTQNQQALYPMIVQSAMTMWDCRCDRINIARQGVPPMEWLTLIVGGIITVVFTYFFGLDNIKIQTVMVGMVTVLIALNLYLFLLFAYPFSGEVCLQPEAFKIDLAIMENRIQGGD